MSKKLNRQGPGQIRNCGLAKGQIAKKTVSEGRGTVQPRAWQINQNISLLSKKTNQRSDTVETVLGQGSSILNKRLEGY